MKYDPVIVSIPFFSFADAVQNRIGTTKGSSTIVKATIIFNGLGKTFVEAMNTKIARLDPTNANISPNKHKTKKKVPAFLKPL